LVIGKASRKVCISLVQSRGVIDGPGHILRPIFNDRTALAELGPDRTDSEKAAEESK